MFTVAVVVAVLRLRARAKDFERKSKTVGVLH
jgi:hypothetical protein